MNYGGCGNHNRRKVTVPIELDTNLALIGISPYTYSSKFKSVQFSILKLS